MYFLHKILNQRVNVPVQYRISILIVFIIIVYVIIVFIIFVYVIIVYVIIVYSNNC